MFGITISGVAQCINGDFEFGDFSNYTLSWEGHSSPGINLNNFTPVTPPAPSHAIITSADYDPWFYTVNIVDQGLYSARVGINYAGSTTSMLGYSFRVTNQNKFFSFRGMIVLNYSTEHPDAGDQAFVQYFMCKGTTPSLDPANVLTVPNAQLTVTANDIPSAWDDYYLEAGSGGTSFHMYKDWAKYCVDLSSYVGQTVSIFFIGSGCVLNNHPGYWYIDEICGSPPPVPSFNVLPFHCSDSRIYADGTNSLNGDDYQWTIEMVTGPNNTVVRNSGVTNTVFGAHPGLVDLSSMYNAGGKTFDPGALYKITLGLRINCTSSKGHPSPFTWVNAVTYIDIPQALIVDAGPDKYFCCANGQGIAQLGSLNNNDPTFSYQWWVWQGSFVSNDAMPIVSPTKSTTYQLVVTTPDGCTASDIVKAIYRTPFTPTIVETCNGAPCNKTVGVTLSFPTNQDPNVPACQGDNYGYEAEKSTNITYLWSNGSTSSTTTVTPGNTPGPFQPGVVNIGVSISDGCQTISTGYAVHTYFGEFPDIEWPNIFSPNGDGIHDIFPVRQITTGDHDNNAYNAYRGEFRIFNRYGQEVNTQIIESCGPNGIPNESFFWDGRINGQDAPIGTYYYTFKLFNCSYPNGKDIHAGFVDIIR